MACILIKTEIFKEMKKPWYYYADNLFSSDLTFCMNAQKLNILIFVDTSNKIGHIGDNIIATEKDYLRAKDPEAIKKYNRLFLKELYARKD